MRIVTVTSFMRLAYGAIVALGLSACGGSATAPNPTVPAAGAQPSGGTQPLTTLATTSMIPSTLGRFGLIQLLDQYGPEPALTASQISSEAPHENAVWGAFQPAAWKAANSAIALSRYTLAVEDTRLISGHTLAWWQANHPDWILYACDSAGNPTKAFAFSGTNFGDVPLAFYLPAVQQYEMSLLKPYLTANGYSALAVDNTNLTNYLRGGNPNFSQSIVAGDYGCGTYASNGTFVRRYASVSDPQFGTDMVNWITATAQSLHASGLKLMINHPLSNAPTQTQESQILGVIDGTLDESGFTDYGRYLTTSINLARYMSQAFSWAEAAQQKHVAFFIADYYCYSGKEPWNNNAPCSTDPASLPPALVDWALASYAMIDEGAADLYVSPDSASNYSYRPEFSRTYGAPCSAYAQPAANVYVRRFQGGYAVINANAPGTSTVVTLPSGHLYSDIEGRSVTQSLRVNGADGYLLLTTNGCS